MSVELLLITLQAQAPGLAPGADQVAEADQEVTVDRDQEVIRGQVAIRGQEADQEVAAEAIVDLEVPGDNQQVLSCKSRQ